ncbi:hypothetical protein ACVI1K_007874 [Bradyrhizobium sp. USDA 4508]|nr:hypothetical protein [Bradyrhizobium sp. USDA 4541]
MIAVTDSVTSIAAGLDKTSSVLALPIVEIRTRAGWPLKLRSSSLRSGFVTAIMEAWTRRSYLKDTADNKCERAARPTCNHDAKSVRC